MTYASIETIETTVNNESIETVRLRIVPFTVFHLTERYVGWLNDPEVVRYSEQRHTRHTVETCEAYWRSFVGTPHRFWAIVTHEPESRHIGNLNAYIDPYNAVADIGLLIGERELWGHGYGREAWNGCIGFLFAIRGLRKITAGTLSVNMGMRKIIGQSGMIEEARRSRQCLVDGAEVDVIYSAIFKSEWAERCNKAMT